MCTCVTRGTAECRCSETATVLLKKGEFIVSCIILQVNRR